MIYDTAEIFYSYFDVDDGTYKIRLSLYLKLKYTPKH